MDVGTQLNQVLNFVSCVDCLVPIFLHFSLSISISLRVGHVCFSQHLEFKTEYFSLFSFPVYYLRELPHIYLFLLYFLKKKSSLTEKKSNDGTKERNRMMRKHRARMVKFI